jgi:hypothetical protein
MKGQILIAEFNDRYEFIIHVRAPVVITSFYTYHTRGGAMKAAKREAKKLGIQI